MQAIILAAGYGTRLRPYTQVRPKPLFPVANQPLLLRLLAQVRAGHGGPIVVNCHHLADQIMAALAPWPELILQPEPTILGTGGSLRLALETLVNEPLLVVNGDLYHDIDLEWVFHQHLLSKNDVTMVLHHCPRFNTVTIEGDRVRAFGASGGEQLAFTGIQVVDPEVLERIPMGRFHHIIDLYQEMAPLGRIGFCRVDGTRWRDIGTPADYLDLHREVLTEGTAATASTDAGQGGWLIDPTARIGAGVELTEWGCIGAGAVIGDGARLSRSVVWEGAQVPAGSRHDGRILTGVAELDMQDPPMEAKP